MSECYEKKDLLPSWWPRDLSPSRIDTWQENGEWYMRLEYNGEYNLNKYTLRIPKVSLGQLSIQRIYTEFLYLRPSSYTYVDFGMGDLLYACPDDHGNVAYLEMSQETHEMTIEQIEEKLGYKIKIVSGEGGKDSYENDECSCE